MRGHNLSCWTDLDYLHDIWEVTFGLYGLYELIRTFLYFWLYVLIASFVARHLIISLFSIKIVRLTISLT